jgi:hypothetical protein
MNILTSKVTNSDLFEWVKLAVVAVLLASMLAIPSFFLGWIMVEIGVPRQQWLWVVVLLWIALIIKVLEGIRA